MLRTEMIDNLLDSYTKRELKALADRLGIVYLQYDTVHNILFDPGGWDEEFNKLAQMEQ